jgi:hypothetical protein
MWPISTRGYNRYREAHRSLSGPLNLCRSLAYGYDVKTFRRLIRICAVVFLTLSLVPATVTAKEDIIATTRLANGPIITADLDESIGLNIQGPSLIRVPDWIKNPLGKYYLYFADHRGTYIRLAYADHLAGPWTIYTPGTLAIEDSFFPETCPPCSPAPGQKTPAYAHIASPDVHVREDLQQIVMYFHGRDVGRQLTRAALSGNGIDFVGRPEPLGRPYFRVFQFNEYHYALAMPGYLYRSRNGLTDFEAGPRLFSDNMRHSALLVKGETLYVFYTNRGDAPERIMVSTVDLTEGWQSWQHNEPTEILRPEMTWEGAEMPLEPSLPGYVSGLVNQLRDPAIYQEDGKLFLLYAVAGESGIAIAELTFK